MPHDDTIAALSTPPGRGALAVVRVSGPLSGRLMRDVFSLKKEIVVRRAYFGRYRSVCGKVLDECVATYFAEGQSFTGEAMLELSLHGNPLIVEEVLDDLFARGCRPAEPGEFSRIAYLNDRIDLTQAEAIADLIAANSEQSIIRAREQLSGALCLEVNRVSGEIVSVVAELEAYLDFPDEDLPTENDGIVLSRLRELVFRLREVVDSQRLRRVVEEGLRVAIVGIPNAGKSSLMNALLESERSIVSSFAGTTRDYLEGSLNLNGLRIQLLDTAGLGLESHNKVEAEGMRRSLVKAESADLILFVVDAAAQRPTLADKVTALLERQTVLLVENKSDLGGYHSDAGFLPTVSRVSVSAKCGNGMDVLRGTIVETLTRANLVPEADAWVVNQRQAQCFKNTELSVEHALQCLKAKEGAEVALIHLRDALEALGSVVGQIDSEAILDELFSNFCIGK